jgi:hypothetical protein
MLADRLLFRKVGRGLLGEGSANHTLGVGRSVSHKWVSLPVHTVMLLSSRPLHRNLPAFLIADQLGIALRPRMPTQRNARHRSRLALFCGHG